MQLPADKNHCALTITDEAFASTSNNILQLFENNLICYPTQSSAL